MSEAAKVVRLSGYGEDHLRDAIQSGMLSADAVRAYKQALSEIQSLRRENNDLKTRLNIVQASRAGERRCKIEAYRMVIAKEAQYQRARDWRISILTAAAAIGGISVAIATVIAVILA